MSQLRFLVSPGRRIVMLFLTCIVGFILTAFVQSLLLNIGGSEKMIAMMRISIVFQDLLVFIIPAIVTALIVTRQPVRLLALGKGPTMLQTVLAVFVMLVSSPLMSWIIELNASVHLPESMAPLENWLRDMENAAETMVEMVLGPRTPGNLFMSVLIIGVLAGFSEELFFRGGLQRLMSTGGVSPIASIWIAGFIFSVLHFQFFGFVPRMLLGVYFGYLLLWSGSVWLPIMIHALNNSMFVILRQITGSGEPQGSFTDGVIPVAVSTLLTAVGIYLLYHHRNKEVR